MAPTVRVAWRFWKSATISSAMPVIMNAESN